MRVISVDESEMVDGQIGRVVCTRSGEVACSTKKHSVRPRPKIYVKVLVITTSNIEDVVENELSLSPSYKWPI